MVWAGFFSFYCYTYILGSSALHAIFFLFKMKLARQPTPSKVKWSAPNQHGWTIANDISSSVFSLHTPTINANVIHAMYYYNRFLPNRATILHPLHQLLEQGNKWQWTEQCEQAFSKAKLLITSELVLTHYDPALPVTLACDASPTGIGAVLSHVMTDGSERPVAFAPRSLTTDWA